MTKLKPCPFCGGEAVRLRVCDEMGVGRHVGDGERVTRYIGCKSCCVASFAECTAPEAVEKWNRRAGK